MKRLPGLIGLTLLTCVLLPFCGCGGKSEDNANLPVDHSNEKPGAGTAPATGGDPNSPKKGGIKPPGI